MLSKHQIDRLGERLRQGAPSDGDRRLLDEYRLTFSAAHEYVIRRLEELGYRPTGRPTKSTAAIVDKLRRESIRLTQIQDVAGCRIVVVGMAEQDDAARRVERALAPARIADRRVSRRHAYRAVHVIIERQDALVEVQIRTAWQHHWAATSEKLADEFGHDLKYGHVRRGWRRRLRAGRSRSGSGRNGAAPVCHPALHSMNRLESRPCISAYCTVSPRCWRLRGT